MPVRVAVVPSMGEELKTFGDQGDVHLSGGLAANQNKQEFLLLETTRKAHNYDGLIQNNKGNWFRKQYTINNDNYKLTQSVVKPLADLIQSSMPLGYTVVDAIMDSNTQRIKIEYITPSGGEMTLFTAVPYNKIALDTLITGHSTHPGLFWLGAGASMSQFYKKGLSNKLSFGDYHVHLPYIDEFYKADPEYSSFIREVMEIKKVSWHEAKQISMSLLSLGDFSHILGLGQGSFMDDLAKELKIELNHRLLATTIYSANKNREIEHFATFNRLRKINGKNVIDMVMPYFKAAKELRDKQKKYWNENDEKKAKAFKHKLLETMYLDENDPIMSGKYASDNSPYSLKQLPVIEENNTTMISTPKKEESKGFSMKKLFKKR